MSLFGFDASSFDSISVPVNQDNNGGDEDDQSNPGDRSILASVSSGEWINSGVSVTDLQPPPVYVQIQHTQPGYVPIEDDDESYGGITILSSVPSSQVPMMLACSPQQAHDSNISSSEGDDSYSVLSTQTLTTHVNAPVFSILGQRSVLSLSPSSLASSMSDMSSLFLSNSSHPSSGPRNENDNKTLSTTITSPAFSRALVTLAKPAPRNWLDRFQTEQDWDVFCQETLMLLTALEEDGATVTNDESRDMMISRLIEQEERLFWNSQQQQNCSSRGVCGMFRRFQQRGLLLLGETLLVAATVAAFGGSPDHYATAHRVVE